MFHGDFNLGRCILKILQWIQKGAKWALLGVCFTVFTPLLPPPPVGNIHFRGFSQSEECSFSNFQGENSSP